MEKETVKQDERTSHPERVGRPVGILNRAIRGSVTRELHVSQDLKKAEERHRGNSQCESQRWEGSWFAWELAVKRPV